jgi:transposase
MKATLIRLGIRGFNPKLKNAAGRLEDLRTPEDQPIPLQGQDDLLPVRY